LPAQPVDATLSNQHRERPQIQKQTEQRQKEPLAAAAKAAKQLAKETAKKRNALALAMRGPWGPKLRDIPGRVLYGTAERPLDEDGNPA
jgi:hypothetical protein